MGIIKKQINIIREINANMVAKKKAKLDEKNKAIVRTKVSDEFVKDLAGYNLDHQNFYFDLHIKRFSKSSLESKKSELLKKLELAKKITIRATELKRLDALKENKNVIEMLDKAIVKIDFLIKMREDIEKIDSMELHKDKQDGRSLDCEKEYSKIVSSIFKSYSKNRINKAKLYEIMANLSRAVSSSGRLENNLETFKKGLKLNKYI